MKTDEQLAQEANALGSKLWQLVNSEGADLEVAITALSHTLNIALVKATDSERGYLEEMFSVTDYMAESYDELRDWCDAEKSESAGAFVSGLVH